MRYFLLTLYFLLGIIATMAFDTGQNIFRKDVKSLVVSNPKDFLAQPVIRLNSNDCLNINFDILQENVEYLRFKLIHCNVDWKPSGLTESEFIKGFNDFLIEDYAFSENTYVHYVNYNIEINQSFVPIISSGNYLLQVYPENDPEDIILQARFSVSEDVFKIDGGVTSRTDKGINSEYQQLYFNIDFSNIPSINPYQDIYVTISQNNNPETERILRNPLRIESNKAIYEHLPDLVFEAGNEFRRFETVRTDYPGMHVDSVKFIDDLWHAWLSPDFPRTEKEYLYDNTQFGKFKIDEYNSTDPNLSADYLMVHFIFDPINQISGNIYLDGDFTNHLYDDSSMMIYDRENNYYKSSQFLKQGSYNYQYVFIPYNDLKPRIKETEGNKYETQNEYLVQVFLRTPGSRADRLLLSKKLK